MDVGSTGHNAIAQVVEFGGESLGILHNLMPIVNELSSEALLQGNSNRLKYTFTACRSE